MINIGFYLLFSNFRLLYFNNEHDFGDFDDRFHVHVHGHVIRDDHDVINVLELLIIMNLVFLMLTILGQVFKVLLDYQKYQL